MRGPELLFEINALKCFGGLKKWGKITIFPDIQYNQKFIPKNSELSRLILRNLVPKNYSTLKQICKGKVRNKINII